MKRILLYSPDVVGHPRVYCRVIADALATEPCQLVVAMGFTDEIGLNESPDIQPLSSRAGVQLIDTRTFSRTGKPHLTAEELVELQLHFDTDTTLFIEADKSKAEFFRIAAGEAPRFRGRNLGIFANTAEWYPGEDSFTGQRRTLLAPTVRTTLGNVKRAIFNRRQSARYFYEKIIIQSGVLDEILVKDERLANWRGPPVHWMPEISRPTAVPESPEEALNSCAGAAKSKVSSRLINTVSQCSISVMPPTTRVTTCFLSSSHLPRQRAPSTRGGRTMPNKGPIFAATSRHCAPR